MSLTGVACGAGDVQASRDKQPANLRPVYDPKTGKLTELLYDSDGDGKPDIRAFMRGATLVRAEIDENGDGKPDRWEYYAVPASESSSGATTGAALPTIRPPLERVDESSANDGKIDRREFYQGGVLARKEQDTNGDGRTDRWDTYDRGVLTTMELDLNHDGTPDRRLTYSVDGTIVQRERLSNSPAKVQ